MAREKQGPDQFLRVLRERLRDLREDSRSAAEVVAELARENPLFEKFKDELLAVSREDWLAETVEKVTAAVSAELRGQIRKQVAFGEFMLREANAFCGSPVSFCGDAGFGTGPLCDKYRGLRACPCRTCEEYEGYVIGINRGLLLLFHGVLELVLATPTIVASYMAGDAQKRFEPLMPRTTAVPLIYEVVKRAAGQLPLSGVRVTFKDERINLLGLISFYGYLFVIAHELAHVLLGHVGASPGRPLRIGDRRLHAFTVTKEHEKEFEADQTGLAILLNCPYAAHGDFGIMSAIAGAESAFFVLELCERIGGLPSGATHPSARSRVERLRETFALPRVYYELSETVVAVGNSIVEEIKEKYSL